MKKLIGLALVFLIVSCQKEELPKPSIFEESFKEVNGLISGKNLKNGDFTLKVGSEIEFENEAGETHKFKVESTSGDYTPAEQPVAQYFGEGYFMEIILVSKSEKKISAFSSFDNEVVLNAIFYY